MGVLISALSGESMTSRGARRLPYFLTDAGGESDNVYGERVSVNITRGVIL